MASSEPLEGHGGGSVSSGLLVGVGMVLVGGCSLRRAGGKVRGWDESGEKHASMACAVFVVSTLCLLRVVLVHFLCLLSEKSPGNCRLLLQLESSSRPQIRCSHVKD